jgi:hypothetical protein
MPVGLSRFYNPTTLPGSTTCQDPNAPCPLSSFYAVRITITPSGCQGTACENDGDWGESTFTIQLTDAPTGKTSTGATASNLIVLVHGCCTNAANVGNDWDSLRTQIENNITQRQTGAWEVVVWDWHEYTPWFGSNEEGLRLGWDIAYQNAKHQGAVLADAIKLHDYTHVHLIGHSAGSKLIHEAATAYIYDYFTRQINPFIHLTFLDAYTPSDFDKNSYGSLPTDYPNHYSEHYVHRGVLLTDACLSKAFNFDITAWNSGCNPADLICLHHWPRNWYNQSISFVPPVEYGYGLSLEGGYNRFSTVATDFPPGQQCSHSLSDVSSICLPAAPTCW